jgi:uncharacterized protein YwqG
MKTHLIEFVRAGAPIEEPVTKFGGAPVWLSQAQWPLGTQSDEPMMFIAQIALDVLGFPGAMAYIFMDDSEEAGNTWSPDAGGNAVVVQPGDNPFPVSPQNDGPRLTELVMLDKRRSEMKPCEYAATLREEEDVVLEGSADVFQNKIGGLPVWLQFDETPGDGWQLLLQLDSVGVPFDINFGDAGVGYAFLAPDGRSGKFLWQCG